MIKYFLSFGDENIANIFTPYVWYEKGLGSLLDEKLSKKNYGSALNLLLICYHVDGKFGVSQYLEPKVGNYSSKESNIAVNITVKDADFLNVDEKSRKLFITNSTIKAVELVKAKLEKRKLDIHFDALLSDVNEVAKNWAGI